MTLSIVVTRPVISVTTSGGGIQPGLITGSGLTMGTDKLLGRDTAGTGAIEEIAIGSGLTLSGGTLDTVGAGTVTSVALTAPTGFSVSGSPITTSGTLALSLDTQSAGEVLAGPTSGPDATPAFRALVATDIPTIAQSQVTNLTTDLAAKADKTTTISAGTGLTGGGDLSANRTISASFGSSAGTICEGNDSRLSDARTPTAHAASHASIGSDPVTLAQSQITNLTTDLSNKVDNGAITGGDLTMNTARLLGRDTVGVGAVEEITVGSGLSLSGGSLSATATGTVTSVGLALPADFTVSGSPVTTIGTLTGAWATQAANKVLAGPVSGGAATPAFRSLVVADTDFPHIKHGIARLTGNAMPATLSYVAGTRILTATPVSVSYDVWNQGSKTTETGAQAFPAHTNATGAYFVDYDATLTKEATTTPWDLLTKIPVALVYYNATLVDAIVYNELHNDRRNLNAHAELHEAVGTYKVSGCDISGYTLNTDTDAANTYAIAVGVVADEDIRWATSALADAGPYFLVRKEGAGGTLTWTTASVVPFFFAGGSFIQYNQFTAGAWQLTALTNNQFVNYYVFGTTATDGAKSYHIMPGQAVHATLAAAQAESWTSVGLGGLLQEFVPLYQITYQAKTANSSTGKVQTVAVTTYSTTRASAASAAAGTPNGAREVTYTVAAADSVLPSKADYLCTGTNDHLTIQAAINALPSTGGEVRLLDGTFNCAGTVTIAKSGVVLSGCRRSSILKRVYNESGADTAGVVTVGDGTNAYSSITVRDLTIDGNSATYTNVNNYGLFVNKRLANSSFFGLTVFNTKSHGIYLLGANTTECTACTIHNNLLSACGASTSGACGIKVTYGINVSILGNQLASCGGTGFSGSAAIGLATATDTIIAENQLKTCPDNGIIVYNCTRAKVDANNITTVTVTGIGVGSSGATSNNVQVVNNHVTSASFAGITYDQSTGKIFGNRLNSCLSGVSVGWYFNDSECSSNVLIACGDSTNPAMSVFNSVRSLFIGNTFTNCGSATGVSPFVLNGSTANDTVDNVVAKNFVTSNSASGAGTQLAYNITANTSRTYFADNVYKNSAGGTACTTMTLAGTNTVAGGTPTGTSMAAWSISGPLVGLGTIAPTAAVHNANASIVSRSAEKLDGAWFTGGTSTTTKPHHLIEPSGATSTAWNTSGTGFGVNSASGFVGDLVNFQVNGSLRCRVEANGNAFLSCAQNTTTQWTITNSDAGTAALARYTLASADTNGSLGIYSTTYTANANRTGRISMQGDSTARGLLFNMLNPTSTSAFNFDTVALTASSGTQTVANVQPTINQSGTAGYTALLVNPTETATGSGSKLLADLQVGGSSKFAVNNTGGIISAATDNDPMGRLTLESGVPVSSTDQTAKTTVYYTPRNGNSIRLYNGASWTAYTFTELSLSLSGWTANKNNDIFIYDNAGTLTLERTEWTDDSTRATALVLQNGVWCKTGALTRRYLGTIRTTGTTGQCEDSVNKRYVWNMYQRVSRTIETSNSNSSWTYATATWRECNGGTGQTRGEFVIGVDDGEPFESRVFGYAYQTAGNNYIQLGLGVDSIVANPASYISFYSSIPTMDRPARPSATRLSAGYHYCTMMEYATAAATATIFGGSTYNMFMLGRM